MAKSCSERQRERRKRLKENNQYDSYKKNESKRRAIREKQKKLNLTPTEKSIKRRTERERKAKYRAANKVKEQQTEPTEVTSTTSTCTSTPLLSESSRNITMSSSSLNRAVKRAEQFLPTSPSKKKLVVKKLALKFSPEYIVKEKKIREDLAIGERVEGMVHDFYLKDDISSPGPGIKDCVIVRDGDGNKSKIQKRFLMHTLHETFQFFKKNYPNCKIGLSKFSELRPLHVCLRDSTPGNVCLCIYHENVRMLIQAVPFLPNSTSEFIQQIVCTEEEEYCMYQKSCESCRNLQKFKLILESQEPDMLNNIVSYKQWIKSSDGKLLRSTLTSTIKEVFAILDQKLVSFLRHVFVKRAQESNLRNLLDKMTYGTLLINADFSENFAHKSQDEIQSVYWDTKSSTLYTTMIYFKDRNDVLHSKPYVVISDYMHHDKYAVVVFNEKILQQFQNDFNDYVISSIHYQSDGTSQHFKQKFTLCSMTLNKVPTHWHFSATSHGKSAVDGLGGTIKRRVSEKIVAEKIDLNTSEEFSNIAVQICQNINILYISKDEIENNVSKLNTLWAPNDREILTIPGTRNCHFFQSVEPYMVNYASHSQCNANDKTLFSFIGECVPDNTKVQLVDKSDLSNGQWVKVLYEGETYHGLITDVKNDNYQIRCLEKTCTGHFKFEDERNAVWYGLSEILSKMESVPTLLNSRGMYQL